MTQNYRFKKADIGIFKEADSDLAVSNFAKDCRILGLTNGSFSLIDLLHSVLKRQDKQG